MKALRIILIVIAGILILIESFTFFVFIKILTDPKYERSGSGLTYFIYEFLITTLILTVSFLLCLFFIKWINKRRVKQEVMKSIESLPS